MNKEQIVAAARQAAIANGIDPARYVALLQHESDNFDPKVLSHQRVSKNKEGKVVGAFGIAQFMPTTGKAFGVELGKPDIAKEIAAGATYMAQLKKQFKGDENLATKAYNFGPGNLRRWLAGEVTLPAETQKHSEEIAKLMGTAGRAVAAAPVAPASLSSKQPAGSIAAPMQPAGAPAVATLPPAEPPRFLASLEAAGMVGDTQPVADVQVQPFDWRENAMAQAAISDAERSRQDYLHAMFSEGPTAQADTVALPSSVLAALDGIIAKV